MYESLNKLGVVLTADESTLVASILNSIGGQDDGRPVADADTIGHFTTEYVVENIREVPGLNADGVKMADRVAARIDAMAARAPNACDGCDNPGSTGTMPIDGDHALVVCCPSCAKRPENPPFTPI